MSRSLRIGVVMDGIVERHRDGTAEIANGGVGVYVYHLIKQLQALAPRHEYFLLRWGSAGLDIYRHPRSRTVTPAPILTRRLARFLDLPSRAFVREHDLDVIHFPNQFGGAFLPRRMRRVVTLHDLTPLLFPRFHPWYRVLAYRLLLRRSLQAADHIIVDATHTADCLIARGLAGPDKISVIPLGVDARFRPVSCTRAFAARYNLPPRYILTVGVLEPRKNHVCLLQALARLHAAGEAIGLVIVGRDGWRWRDPLQTPSLAALQPWVRILRNVPDGDLPALYCGAVAFAYPSLYEGFGLPVLEAMACGTPVVAANAASLPEVAGGAALLADPHDPADLAARLAAVLTDEPLRQRLRVGGFARARELSWRRTAERTLAVYTQVCDA